MVAQTSLTVKTRELASADELARYVADAKGYACVLGNTKDNPREFYCFEIDRAGTPLAKIGIASWGIGVKPECLLVKELAFVGFNKNVAVIDLSDGRGVNDIFLDTPFWTFIRIPQGNNIYALCETEVVGISESGSFKWRYGRDLITDYEVSGHYMILTFSDVPPAKLDLMSGAADTLS